MTSIESEKEWRVSREKAKGEQFCYWEISLDREETTSPLMLFVICRKTWSVTKT